MTWTAACAHLSELSLAALLSFTDAFTDAHSYGGNSCTTRCCFTDNGVYSLSSTIDELVSAACALLTDWQAVERSLGVDTELVGWLVQGVLIRRHRMEKSDGTFFAPGDFVVGDNVSFYGRTFHIVDADVFTREAMAEAGLEYGPAETYPNDPFTTKRLSTQRHGFGQSTTLTFFCCCYISKVLLLLLIQL